MFITKYYYINILYISTKKKYFNILIKIIQNNRNKIMYILFKIPQKKNIYINKKILIYIMTKILQTIKNFLHLLLLQAIIYFPLIFIKKCIFGSYIINLPFQICIPLISS